MCAKFLNLGPLMEADPSLPGWDGWSAPPPSANGGRPAIQTWMKFVVLRLANRRRRARVRTTYSPAHMAGLPPQPPPG